VSYQLDKNSKRRRKLYLGFISPSFLGQLAEPDFSAPPLHSLWVD